LLLLLLLLLLAAAADGGGGGKVPALFGSLGSARLCRICCCLLLTFFPISPRRFSIPRYAP
jgi:hypothetical protein